MAKMELQKSILGPVCTNCYFIMNKDTRELLLVDPAAEADAIIKKITDMGAVPVGILLTHGHFDHIMGVNGVKEKYDIPVYAYCKEQEMLSDASVNMSSFYGACTVKADHLLNDLDVFEAAGFSIQVLHTPGHTKGSCCYYLSEENALFSGDTLLCGSVGRTDFPGGSMSEIVRSLHRLLDSLPEDTNVYPGHDTFTTIGYEKRYNPFV